MGYKAKLIVGSAGIKLPKKFINKYKEDYHIDDESPLNISSKCENKCHFDIISDLEEILEGYKYDVWAITLWEDGVIDRHNLSKCTTESIRNGEFEN